MRRNYAERPKHWVKAGVMLGLAGMLPAGGCSSYHASPLDAHGARRAYYARAADAGEVLARFETERAKGRHDLSFDLSDGLSLDEAEIVALVFNGEARAARGRAGVPLAGVEHAGLWEDPTLGVDVTRVLADVTHVWKTSVPVGLTIPVSGRLGAAASLTQSEARLAMTEAARVEWNVIIALRHAWNEWSAAERSHRLARELNEGLNAIVAIVDHLEQAGEVARVEARVVRLEQAGRHADLRRMENEADAAERKIRALLGVASPVALIPGLSSHVPEGEIDALRDRLLRTNALVRVAEARYDAAERELALEIRRQYPDVQLGGGIGAEDGDAQASVGVGVTLPLWNRNRRAVAEAHAAREAARLEYEAACEAALAELDAGLASWTRSRTARDEVTRVIVPLSNAQAQDMRALAGLGEMNVMLMLESLRTQFDVARRLIDAEAAVAAACVRVGAVLGQVDEPPSAGGMEP